MKKVFLLIFGVLIFGVIIFTVKNNSSIKQLVTSSKNIDILQPTPTPFPFQELTVPYLRQRTYTSSLGPRTLVSQNGTYNSYLTSYDSDGFKVNGLLTIPKGEEPKNGWPAIIFIHGYIPPAQYNTQTQYADYVDYLARNGVVVFKIDLRGHGNSEGEAGGGYYSSDYVIDTLNAYSALQNSDFVNPKAIGLWGHSMAGNIVLRSMVVKRDIPASVIWAGAGYTYADLLTYGLHDSSYQPQPADNAARRKSTSIRNVYGNPDNTNPFWQQVIPTNYLHDIKGAIEINHAVDDPVVNIGYSRDLMALLDKTLVPHQLYEYQSGGHNISGSSFNQAMQRTVEFYKKYLKE